MRHTTPRPTRRTACTLALAAILLAACSDDQGPVSVPDAGVQAPGSEAGAAGNVLSYTAVAGDDWRSYATKDQLKAKDYFWWFRTEDVYQDVDLVADPVFGQVARIRFRQSDETGWAPKLSAGFAPLDRMWFRYRMRFTPGFTTAAPLPSGYANAYKVSFWLWEGLEGRGQVELSNTTEYVLGFRVGAAGGGYVSFNERQLPGSQPWGHVSTEWSDNEWWEYVIYYEKTGSTSARQHWWKRRLTNSGAVANNPWTYIGIEVTGAPTPRAAEIMLGANKNKNNPSTMYIHWGPWEVVDGTRFANPWSMPNLGTTPPPPTLTRVNVTPDTATLAPSAARQFSAAGTYSDGTSGPVTAAWSATGGTVSASGLYTAPATAGTYRVIGRETATGLADTSTVTVAAAPGPTLQQVTVTPATASAQTGGTVQFAASGRYSDGSSRAVAVAWSATGGTITTAGLYTAGQTAGTFRVIGREAATGLADTSAVTVTTAPAPTLQQVIVTPATASAQTGGTVQFAASGRYSDGSSRAVTVAWSATGGTITTAGLYTAGQTAGTFRVIGREAASGKADTSTVTVAAPPPSGSYTRLVGDDWRSYTSKTQLSTYYSSADLANVALVSDGTFGQVVRLTNPAGSTASPRLTRSLPAPANRVWYRWRVKFSPGWTTGGGTWTMSQWTWSGYNGVASAGFSGTSHQLGFNVRDASYRYLSYAETVLPGSSTWGSVGTEFGDGQWYEYVMLWEKTGSTTGRQHWWVRRLTTGGAIVNNPWKYYGISLSGAATPQVGAVSLGAGNLGRAPAAAQYVYWGPWEVVDGTRYANPFGMSGF